MVDSVMTKLETSNQFVSASIEKVLGQIKETENTAKVTLMINQSNGEKVSVVAIAPMDKQVDPMIESVRPITS